MKLLRVTKHKMYVNKYIAERRWDIVNICLHSRKLPTKDLVSKINAKGDLIKKYERRLKLLRY